MSKGYKIAFEINLLCEFYKDNSCRDFDLIPSPETKRLLKKYQMMYRMQGNKLFVLMRVESDGTPFIPLDAEDSFVFHLYLKHPEFISISNVDLKKFQQKRYYFSNLSANEIGDTLYLSLPIDNYDNAGSYSPGDFAKNGDRVFECIKTTTGGHNTSEAEYWRSKGEHQYASSRDMLTLIPGIHTFYVVSAATVFNVKAFGLNKATGGFDVEVALPNSTIRMGYEPTSHVQVNLSTLPSGRYLITINGEEFEVYIDQQRAHQQIFGVLEIFAHLSGANSFSLLDAQGKLKDTIVGDTPHWLVFSLRYANRLAYWKYIPTRKTVSAIKDATLTFSFAQSPVHPAVPDYFISEQPIPLVEKPFVFEVELSGLAGSSPSKAPNPNLKVGGMLKQVEKDYQCIIYLNY